MAPNVSFLIGIQESKKSVCELVVKIKDLHFLFSRQLVSVCILSSKYLTKREIYINKTIIRLYSYISLYMICFSNLDNFETSLDFNNHLEFVVFCNNFLIVKI